MTCIIGVVGQGISIMAADDMASYGDFIRLKLSGSQKLKNHNGMLWGVAGYTASAQVIMYQFKPESMQNEPSVLEYLVTKFVPPLRDLMREHGRLTTHKPEAEMWDSRMMVIMHDTIAVIREDFAVTVCEEEYEAIGSGEEVAKGALAMSRDMLPTRKRLEQVMQAVAHHCIHVNPTCHFVQMGTEMQYEDSSHIGHA